jgi:hypothetical protein
VIAVKTPGRGLHRSTPERIAAQITVQMLRDRLPHLFPGGGRWTLGEVIGTVVTEVKAQSDRADAETTRAGMWQDYGRRQEARSRALVEEVAQLRGDGRLTDGEIEAHVRARTLADMESDRLRGQLQAAEAEAAKHVASEAEALSRLQAVRDMCDRVSADLGAAGEVMVPIDGLRALIDAPLPESSEESQ